MFLGASPQIRCITIHKNIGGCPTYPCSQTSHSSTRYHSAGNEHCTRPGNKTSDATPKIFTVEFHSHVLDNFQNESLHSIGVCVVTKDGGCDVCIL